MENKEKYADMLHMARPVIPGRAVMSQADRAAQFAPFAALTGYDAVIHETARVTQPPAILEQDRVQELDRQLFELAQQPSPRVWLTVFQPDDRKSGGAYQRLCAVVRRVDAQRQCLVLEDGKQVDFSCIYQLEQA